MNLPAVQETHVQALGQEDPLAKGMATHSSPLAWRIPWTEEPGGLQSVGPQSDTTSHMHARAHRCRNVSIYTCFKMENLSRGRGSL